MQLCVAFADPKPPGLGKQFLVQIFMGPADPQAGNLCWKVVYSKLQKSWEI